MNTAMRISRDVLHFTKKGHFGVSIPRTILHSVFTIMLIPHQLLFSSIRPPALSLSYIPINSTYPSHPSLSCAKPTTPAPTVSAHPPTSPTSSGTFLPRFVRQSPYLHRPAWARLRACWRGFAWCSPNAAIPVDSCADFPGRTRLC